jgi:hypothetical protein
MIPFLQAAAVGWVAHNSQYRNPKLILFPLFYRHFIQLRRHWFCAFKNDLILILFNKMKLTNPTEIKQGSITGD